MKVGAIRNGPRQCSFQVSGLRWNPARTKNVLRFLHATLFDAGLLTCEVTQIIKFCATNLTVFVDGDGFDERRLDGEDTLHADSV